MPIPSRLARAIAILLLILAAPRIGAQINTDQVLRIGQNNLYFEDYVLSIQYFNRVISVKPYLAQPYFYRAVAKLNLDDYLGAEQDATLALERNPFIVDAWEVRGVARQNLGKPREAIEDYSKALDMLPGNRGLLYNKAIAQQDIGDLGGADSTFAVLLKRFPGFDGGYIGRARLRLEQKDTVAAKEDIEKALSINHNSVNGYIMRADIAINQAKDYASALEDMNRAIKLQPRHAGFFINRAFLRYMNDDFQGAFADYDYAIQLEPQNTVALFNRGLLRTEVHDTDKAIKDFDAVLDLNPDDHKSLYNRAIILSEVGQLDRAIADLDKLIEFYPDFAAAYFVRFDAKRRKGDMAGAERDYKKSLALADTRIQKTPDKQFASDNGVATDSVSALGSDLASAHPGETQEQVKRRFSSLTTIDDNSYAEQVFNSKEIRGRVQDRNRAIELEPIFVVTYYTSPTELKLSGDYLKEVDQINATRALRFLLQLTNHEPATTDEETARTHFESVGYYNSYLAGHTPRAIDYLGRAMDFVTLRDYESAVADLDKAIALTPDFTLAYLIRANARYLMAKTGTHSEPKENTAKGLPGLGHNTLIRSALDDLDTVAKLSPQMPIAYYNKGVILAEEGDHTSALMALTRAIDLKPDFGEAYYNRGYVYLTLGNKEAAFKDLSRAGNLGIVASYNLLKRMN